MAYLEKNVTIHYFLLFQVRMTSAWWRCGRWTRTTWWRSPGPSSHTHRSPRKTSSSSRSLWVYTWCCTKNWSMMLTYTPNLYSTHPTSYKWLVHTQSPHCRTLFYLLDEKCETILQTWNCIHQYRKLPPCIIPSTTDDALTLNHTGDWQTCEAGGGLCKC